MPIAAVEARIAHIESTLSTLSPQRAVAAGSSLGSTALAGTSGVGGVIGSTGTVPGAGATSGTASGEAFSAVLEDALGTGTDATSPAATGTGAAPAAGTGAAPATGAVGASSGGTDFGDSIVETAKKHLGIRYTWGGNSPSQGFDCSGLVKHVMKELGVSMPRVARDQAKVGTEIGSLAEAQPGDLLGMRNGKHIAIYLGDNKILHAPQPGENVSIRSLFSWDDIDTIRRVAPAGGSGAASNAGSTRAAFEQLAGASA